MALGGCWTQVLRPPAPDLSGHYADDAVVTRKLPGYELWYKRDFRFAPATAEGTIEFYEDPQGQARTLSAHVIANYELTAKLAADEYAATIRFMAVTLTPRAPFMVDLLAADTCGAGPWRLDEGGDILATQGCKSLAFALPAWDRVKLYPRGIQVGEEPPLVRRP